MPLLTSLVKGKGRLSYKQWDLSATQRLCTIWIASTGGKDNKERSGRMSKTLQQKPVLRDVKKDSLPTAKGEEK